MNQLEESVTTLCRYVRQLAQFFCQVMVEKYAKQCVLVIGVNFIYIALCPIWMLAWVFFFHSLVLDFSYCICTLQNYCFILVFLYANVSAISSYWFCE
jgi:hypothetical protein